MTTDSMRRRFDRLLDGCAPTWRREPRYEGLCSDGWYQDADGKLCYTPKPLVRAVTLGAGLPTGGQLAEIECELRKAPAKVLADFREHGGQVEVVPHGQAYLHPVAKFYRRTAETIGFCSQGPYYAPLIVIQADAEPGTVLHECGHFVDREQRFSRLPEWQRMAAAATEITCWRGSLADSDGGCLAGFYNARRNPCEAFCEAFSLMYFSPRTRRHLPDDMQRFIERATA